MNILAYFTMESILKKSFITLTSGHLLKEAPAMFPKISPEN